MIEEATFSYYNEDDEFQIIASYVYFKTLLDTLMGAQEAKVHSLMDEDVSFCHQGILTGISGVASDLVKHRAKMGSPVSNNFESLSKYFCVSPAVCWFEG